MIHPAPEKVAISPFVILVGRRQKVHFQVLLMDLLKLVLFGRAKLVAVKDILGISQVPRLLIRCFISHIA